MHWQAAENPRPLPSARAETVWVDDATLTPLQTGRMRVLDRDWRWVTGAVYDSEGRLVPQSQRDWDRSDSQPAPVDPEVIELPAEVERTLEGSWAFGGHWARHFGHFLIETLPNLWAAEALRLPGIVAIESAYMTTHAGDHSGLLSPRLKRWQRQLLELAGFGGHELLVSRYQPIRVERLLVAERPVLLHQWVRPEAVALWRRISDAVGKRAAVEKVFLSRTRFNAETGTSATGELRTDPEWDALLDATFARAGFEIVHPEDLSIRDQIALVRGAGIIAGSSGSALHLSCFARPSTRVIEIGDLRTGDESLRTQRALDAACGHRVAYIRYADTAALASVPELVRTDPGRWQPARIAARWRRRLQARV